jgi:hypothetical protein
MMRRTLRTTFSALLLSLLACSALAGVFAELRESNETPD